MRLANEILAIRFRIATIWQARLYADNNQAVSALRTHLFFWNVNNERLEWFCHGLTFISMLMASYFTLVERSLALQLSATQLSDVNRWNQLLMVFFCSLNKSSTYKLFWPCNQRFHNMLWNRWKWQSRENAYIGNLLILLCFCTIFYHVCVSKFEWSK